MPDYQRLDSRQSQRGSLLTRDLEATRVNARFLPATWQPPESTLASYQRLGSHQSQRLLRQCGRSSGQLCRSWSSCRCAECQVTVSPAPRRNSPRLPRRIQPACIRVYSHVYKNPVANDVSRCVASMRQLHIVHTGRTPLPSHKHLSHAPAHRCRSSPSQTSTPSDRS